MFLERALHLSIVERHMQRIPQPDGSHYAEVVIADDITGTVVRPSNKHLVATRAAGATEFDVRLVGLVEEEGEPEVKETVLISNRRFMRASHAIYEAEDILRKNRKQLQA